MKGKLFTEQERQILEDIIIHRRTEFGGNFIDKEIPDRQLERLIFAATHAASVGYSQPWEFVIIRDRAIKAKIKACYETEQQKAKAIFHKQQDYEQLQLEGITETPINIAIFYKPTSHPVLGQTSIDKVGPYSVCLAVQNLWLMARAENIGVGWVSILDEQKVKAILHAPPENQLIAYLCIGYVKEFRDRPQLESIGWGTRKATESVLFYDSYNT